MNIHSYLRRKKINAVFICILTIILALAGCSSSVNDEAGEEGESYELSDQINIPIKVLRDINPATSNDADVYQISKLVYDSLISLDDTLAPESDLADSWSFSENRSSITFELGSGTKFSDGSEFGADDVVFSFNAFKAAASPVYKDKIDRIASVRAEDNDTVIFKITDPENINIADFDFPIFSSKQFRSVSEFIDNNDGMILGTGPYKIDHVDLDKEIRISANEYYRNSKPENSITFEVFSVDSLYSGLINSGEINVSIYTETDREDLTADSELKVTEFTSNQFETLGFNCVSGVMADKVLRQAVACMIDRDEIINTAYYNGGTKNDDLIYPGYYGTSADTTYKQDKSKAQQYMAEAGYSETGNSGYVKDEEGNELTLDLVINSDNEMRKNAADMIADDLFGFGIKVNVRTVDSASFESVIAAGDYDLFLGGWQVSEDMDLRSFYQSGSNYVNYSNSKVDALLRDMSAGADPEEMRNDVAALKEILRDDIPYLCIMYKTYVAVTSRDLQGTMAPRFNDYYYTCSDWKVKVYTDPNESSD